MRRRTNLGQEVGGLDVGVVHGVEVVFGGVLDRAHVHQGGVGDEDVDAAERVDGGVDEPLQLRHLGVVGLDGDGTAAAADLPDHLVGGGGVAAVVHDNLGALGGGVEGDGLSDPLGTAGNDDDLVLERHVEGFFFVLFCITSG